MTSLEKISKENHEAWMTLHKINGLVDHPIDARRFRKLVKDILQEYCEEVEKIRDA